MKRTLISAMLVLCAVFTGCQNPEIQGSQTYDGELALNAISGEAGLRTKGYVEGPTFYETLCENLHGAAKPDATPRTMQLSAYLHPQDGAEGNYFVGTTFAKGDDNLWHADPKIYWPVGGKLDFLAYSLTTEAKYNKDIKVAWNEENAAEEVTLKVPAENTQNDILYASASKVKQTSASGKVDMTFKHAQAWLEFSVKSSGTDNVVKVKGIEIENAYNAGTLTLNNNSGVALAKWDFAGQKAQNIPVDDIFGVNGKALATSEKYYDMLIPQQEKTSFVIYYAFGENADLNDPDEILSYRFATDQKTWLMGEKYVYNITIAANEVLVQPTVTNWNEKYYSYGENLYKNEFTVNGKSEFEYTGGETTLKLVSAKTEGDVTTLAEWKLQWQDEDGEWHDAVADNVYGGWIKFDKVAGAPTKAVLEGVDTVDIKATILSASSLAIPDSIFSASGDNRIIEAISSTETNPRDLSVYDIRGTKRANNKVVTANSYVISKAGWYAFPLVYGNAIDQTKEYASTGGDNTYAYKPGAASSSSSYLTPFKNASNADITTPYITGAKKVEVLWQDVPYSGQILNKNCYLIEKGTSGTELSLINSCDYAVFYTDPKTLTQGNAVIAVKDNSGNILWSWNIWAYNHLEEKAYNNEAGQSLKMLNHPLGWVDNNITSYIVGYYAQEMTVRVLQNQPKEDGAENWVYSEEITLTRNEHKKSSSYYSRGGSCNYYQWGRKDAFVRGDYNRMTGDGFLADGSSVTLGGAISNPNHFYSPNPWYNNGGNFYNNLWSALSTGEGTGAEGYDVNPVKTVYDPCPPGYQVPQDDAFTPLNQWGNYSGERKFVKDGVNVVFPYVGYYIGGQSSYTDWGSNSWYWTAISGGNKAGRLYQLKNAQGKTARNRSSINSGAPVMPVAEVNALPEPELEYVTIGGKKWATKNLGATTVAGSLSTCAGDFYQWGSLNTLYESIIWDGTTPTFNWKTGKEKGFEADNLEYQPTESSLALPDERDVVQKKIGKGWHMPAPDDFQALYEACGGTNDRCKPTTLSSATPGKGIYWVSAAQILISDYTGVAGILFCDGTSRLFFPFSGSYLTSSEGGTWATPGEQASYWSNNCYCSSAVCILGLWGDSDVIPINESLDGQIFCGMAIRPVKD